MNYKIEYTPENMTEMVKACSFKKISMCYHAMALAMILFASVLYPMRVSMSIGMLVGAVIWEIGLISTKKKYLKNVLGQHDINSKGTGIIKNDLQFGETSVVIRNQESGNTIEIQYDKFKKLKESENYFIVLTKYEQFIGVPKEEAERDQLKEYLMSRMKKK